MAIVGYEIDQVRRAPKGDVSVPISANYNHHYTSFIVGAEASVREVHPTGPDDPLAKKVVEQQGGGCGSRVSWGQPQYPAFDRFLGFDGSEVGRKAEPQNSYSSFSAVSTPFCSC